MDLAKIRKKSACFHEQINELRHAQPVSVTAPVLQVCESVPSVIEEMNPFSQGVSRNAETALSVITPPLVFKGTTELSPLEAILAGRKAAGCNDEAVLADENDSPVFSETLLEFLCFRVYNEVYCINIMDIKEIIKPREVTEVPRAPAFLSGVLSLRGTIIPIIDMRLRLGLTQTESTGKERIIVIRNENNFSGLLVDEVMQVVKVQHSSIEAAPTVLDGIDRDFVSGIGRSDNRLMIVLNLENIININMY